MKKYEWINIDSEEVLKKNFKFKDICKVVLSDLNLTGVITIRKFSNLFKLITALNTFKKENIVYDDKFFLSEELKIAFMLLYYNKQFNDELGITQRHYVDRDKAKEWRNKYIKIFHTDLGTRFEQQEETVSSINTIYKRMIGEA
ncbi:hypothetical protein [Clostridium estertheticum]|uniref:Uncharacterized protein n=1 Tax=Clostridium estertheticum subsp. estertheticum TaxID=1552 RepID=A0A1J0GC35_9CLOT|nr:hypothetical protein [Clostridium estertheticum]APC38898.1 hypothetical protein A7L45_01850 [Clostridium estertheticum subsp. estertheticum]MBZ9615155.1 hypothetical protein [Clostridium estertheticum subsp. laramiense]WAG75050.1 hypothetical protein LL032_06255 [Clostridium estertheticum]